MIVYVLYCRDSHKCYVGQTKCELDIRWNWHMRGQCNIHLKRAIKKYGPDAFERTVLAVASSQSQLDHLERLWILVLKSSNRRFGYNIRPGGNSVHSVATKRKISKSKTGIGQKRSVRKKISQSMKAYWKRRKQGGTSPAV